MIVPMAKIRVLGPSSRLSAVIALFQELGAIHIESAPSDIRRLQSDIPVIRRHVLDPAAQQTRAILETALEKVRQLLLSPPSPRGGKAKGSATSSRIPPGRTRSRPSTFTWTPSWRAPRPSSPI
jgi:hypothetical protein